MRRVLCAVASLALILSTCSILRAQAISSPAPRSALAALALRMPQVKFDGTRFADAVEYLRETSGANFHVDWRQLESVGVTRDTPVTFSARNITLRKALGLMLSQAANPGDLAFYNDGGVIEITTKAVSDEALITRVYDVQDLLILPMSMNGTSGNGNTSNSGYSSSSSGSRSSSRGGSGNGGGGSSGILSRSSRTMGSGGSGGGGYGGGGRSSSYSSSRGGTGTSGGTGNNSDQAALADELVMLIMDTIEPSVWQENGGTASIRAFRSNLIITAPRRIHERIGGAFE